MQDQAGGAAFAVGLECDLSIDNLVKKIPFALRKYFEFWLAGSLHEKVSALAGDGQHKVRRQLKAACKAVEQLWVERDFLVLLRRLRLEQRIRRVKQMVANVVDSSCRKRVRQHHDANAGLRVITHERPVPIGAAVVPDDIAAALREDVPPHGDL